MLLWHPRCQDTFVWVQHEDNPTHGSKATHFSLQNQGYGKEEFTTLQCWVPKASYDFPPMHLVSKPSSTNQRNPQTHKKMKQIWIPKGQSPTQATSCKSHCNKNSSKSQAQRGTNPSTNQKYYA